MEEGREASAAAASSGVLGSAEAHDGTKAAATMKVVAAVDASEESLHAPSWALDNIVGLHPGASVVVVHSQHRVDHVVYPVAAHVCVCRSGRGLRADHGDRHHEEDAGGELQEGRGVRAGHLQPETGERHGGGRGGRREGGRGGHARRSPRPGQPRPGHDQEGIAGQCQRLPRPSRVLPCSGCEATQSA